MYNTDKGDGSSVKVYLIETEEMFIGLSEIPVAGCPQVKSEIADVQAVRYCHDFEKPAGDEDVQALYDRALDIIRNEKNSDELAALSNSAMRLYKAGEKKRYWFKDSPGRDFHDKPYGYVF